MNIQYPNLKRNGNLEYGNHPDKIILHHPEFKGTPEQLNDMMINMGFTMCGYNFYVRMDGSVYAMRPVDAIGGNCYGQNACSIGVAAEGNFMVDIMPEIQKQSVIDLCKYLKGQYKSITEIGPHNKYWNTACPGKNYPVSDVINAVNSQSTPAPGNPLPSSQSGLLKLWSTGDAVKDLQTKLNKLGYGLTMDGIFGQNTFNAVEHFQASNKLIVDGIVGPNTLNTLDATIANLSIINIGTYKYLQYEIGATEDNIPGQETLSKCPLVKIGASGNIVKWIQTKLGISADGIFGRQTLIAMQNFQAKHGLAADGIVGQNTWRKLLGL